MPKVSLKEVSVGLVLAADVTNRNGVVLLKQGMTISERQINVLKTWGITHVDIEGNDNETPLQELIAAHPEYMTEADSRAAQLFAHADGKHPLFQALMPLWKQRFVLNRIKQP